MKKITLRESGEVCKLTMPKEMSEWFDERIGTGQYSTVVDNGVKGFACKSRDCTVVMFPNWNCDSQFQSITNKLRK